MKNYFKKYLFVIIVLCFMFGGFRNAYASTLTKEETLYKFERYDAFHGFYSSDVYKNYYIDGLVGYCIEPTVHEGTNNYTLGSFHDIGLSEEIKNKVLLIGYYGYTYPGHETLKYRMATQALIWEVIMGEGSVVKFYTDYWGHGSEIDVTYERAEIERLMNIHELKPSFSEQKLDYNFDDKIILHDNNNVLENYNVSMTNASFLVDGNDLIITPIKDGVINISMQRVNQYSSKYKIYTGSNIQNIYSAGNLERNVETFTKINVYKYSNFEVYKMGERFVINNNEFSYTYIPLENVEFEVYADGDINSTDGNIQYYKNGELVDILKTDLKGYVRSNDLPIGNYILKEVKTQDGYNLPSNIYHVDLAKINSQNRLELYNNLKKGNVEITKLDANLNIPLENALIEIFDSDKRLIYSGKTSNDGRISLERLKVGKYYYREKESPVGYVLDEDNHYFEIKNNNETINEVLTNYKIKSKVIVHKVDDEGIPLEGVEIGFFDLDGNLIETCYTNVSGEATITLEYGSYYYKELNTISNYVVDDQKYYFEVLNNDEVLESTLINEIIKVPKTLLEDLKVLDTIGLKLILAGGVFILYEKKQK